MIFLKAANLFRQTSTFFPTFKNAVQRDGFFPGKDPSKLHNCKQYFWIRPDGSTLQTAYLNALEDGFREEIILFHFVRHVAKNLSDSIIGFNIMSRDDPWDFKVGFSSGVTVNIEISSFTDREKLFQRLSAEELMQRHSHYREIRLGILKKIVKLFPDNELQVLIDQHQKQGKKNSDEVENPYFSGTPKLFLSTTVLPILDLEEQIRKAIIKKNKKNHSDKSNTILVLDNRTGTAGLDEFERLSKNIQPLLTWSPFPEIWLYTGYGGGHDSRYEDFLILPMKLPSEISEKYIKNRFFS